VETLVDEARWAEVAMRHAPALFRLAVMLTGSRFEAEDLLQSCLERAGRHGERVAAMAAPAAYLRRVLVNEHLSRARRLRRRVVEVAADHAPEPSAPDTVDAIDHRDEAWRWLATLPRQQRAVLVLRFYEDLPDDEIAELLGCSRVTVRSNASRGLASLRALLASTSSEQS
jgi:RNA polymerase sigma-70 factor (sigma-E family)